MPADSSSSFTGCLQPWSNAPGGSRHTHARQGKDDIPTIGNWCFHSVQGRYYFISSTFNLLLAAHTLIANHREKAALGGDATACRSWQQAQGTAGQAETAFELQQVVHWPLSQSNRVHTANCGLAGRAPP